MPDTNTVAIGAPFNDDYGTESGHVRVYKWSGSSWIQKGNDIDGEAAGDFSGHSVSMPDANNVAIGAIYNGGNGVWAGNVRIYHWKGNLWQQKGIDIDGEAAKDYSGYSVSMPDSSTVAIGAYYNDGSGVQSGHLRVFELSNKIGKGDDLILIGSYLKIFPNPTTGSISINTTDTKPTRVRVLDITGKEIINTTYTETIHLPEHLSGVFVIELEVEGNIYREKVLKL